MLDLLLLKHIIVLTLGSENMPAIPLNETLEKTMLPNAGKVSGLVRRILLY